MIIDASYFQNKSVYIPNSVHQPLLGENTPSAVEELNQEINDREASLLLDALGFDQTKELYSQFDEFGFWKEDAEQKWIDLVDGKGDWRGLRYVVGSKKVSLIAYYVYFFYLRDDYSIYTTTGIVTSDSANSSTLSPVNKQVNAWNEFVKMYNPIRSVSLIPQPIMGTNWNGTYISFAGSNIQRNIVTLYDFLVANSDIYDTSYFKSYGLINDLGL